MAKKKVYRRKPAAIGKEKPQKRPFPWKKAGILLASFLFFFVLYQIGVHNRWLWVLHVYCAAAGVLALAYGIWNRGVFSVPKEKDLPDAWKREEKEAFIEAVRRRKRQSSVLLYFLIPLILTVVFDMFYLFVNLNMGLDL